MSEQWTKTIEPGAVTIPAKGQRVRWATYYIADGSSLTGMQAKVGAIEVPGDEGVLTRSIQSTVGPAELKAHLTGAGVGARPVFGLHIKRSDGTAVVRDVDAIAWLRRAEVTG